MGNTFLSALKQLGGAWVFYTCLPLPAWLPLDLTRIARWAPGIGLLIGTTLALADVGLAKFHLPSLPRSVLVVTLWLGLTGGLHLDGAMDTADGLAVSQERRLTVMTDSRSGAFGGMVAVLIVFLKASALSAITTHRVWALLLAPVWGRWGQVVAISAYPYLKTEGKGAFHHQSFQRPWDWLPGGMVLILLVSLQFSITDHWQTVETFIAGLLISSFTGIWFNWQVGGMTGDVYGAIVEWTEALLLQALLLEIPIPLMLS